MQNWTYPSEQLLKLVCHLECHWAWFQSLSLSQTTALKKKVTWPHPLLIWLNSALTLPTLTFSCEQHLNISSFNYYKQIGAITWQEFGKEHLQPHVRKSSFTLIPVYTESLPFLFSLFQRLFFANQTKKSELKWWLDTTS